MKRTLAWTVGVVGLIVGLGLMAEAAKKQQAEKKTEAPPAAAMPEEKVAFTFENDEKMEEFTRLWQQRQGMIVRMTVLQAYWNEEQAALAQVNNKLAADYQLDTSKNYSLDPKRRVLIEREALPVSLPNDQASATQPAAATKQ